MKTISRIMFKRKQGKARLDNEKEYITWAIRKMLFFLRTVKSVGTAQGYFKRLIELRVVSKIELALP
jgi:hypothetical protein